MDTNMGTNKWRISMCAFSAGMASIHTECSMSIKKQLTIGEHL